MMQKMRFGLGRELGHVLRTLAVFAAPALLFGCNAAPTGHAPGLAGGESLTPGVTNYPLAYIKKPIPKNDIDARDLITSITGGDLYVRATASAGGSEINVTGSITGGKGDVRDLDVSPDGKKLVFSLRLPLKANLKNTDPKQPNWKIYQYDATAKTVTQLTKDDITSGHDVGAHYLADGRIVFASTRQLATQSILLDESRPQYQAVTDDRQQRIFLLHVMNADGSRMQQISFNTNHDFGPSLLANGQIVFTRWENENGADQMSLYTANVDGTGLQLLYGANSHASGANIAGTNDNVIQFLNPRQRADGKIIVIDRPLQNTQLGGDILIIDTANYVDIHQASTSTTPAAVNPALLGQVSATTLGITTDESMPSLGGRFFSAYPLYDGTNRMLVSWSPCLVIVSGATQVCTNQNTTGATVQLAPLQYTLWVYDFDAGTLGPLLGADTGMMVVEPVVMQARVPVPAFPNLPPATTEQQNLINAGVGVLDISSVYDFDGNDTAKPSIAGVSDPSQAAFYTRSARFIRIEKAVEIPDMTVRKIDPTAFGPAGMGMREILGYAPIEPDGSVQIQVPANVPFTIDVLDKNARRISAQHTSWLQVVPGETKTCNGCHDGAAKTSHGRLGLTVAVNKGAPTTGLPFPNTNPALFANQGETMAQTQARISCAKGSGVTCSQLLTSDVDYETVWTQGTPSAAKDTRIDYPYSAPLIGLNGTPPTNANCLPWSAQCRITIHYALPAPASQPNFLQSMWSLSSRVSPVDGKTNITCTNCHNTTAANKVQVPAGQLDLTGGSDNQVPTVVTSYEILLFPHNEQTLNMGTLQDAPGPVVLAPPMVAGNAIASQPNFLSKFDGTDHGATVDHTGYLTIGEMRLISEWLDIGAQFYNDPFVAPAAN
jgi:hypothetical protein